VSTRYDLSDPESREAGLAAAVGAVRRGLLVVLPTDTVYGIGVDAFDADGIQRLLDAKGRGRDMPPPVLVSASTTLEALASDLPGWVEGLTEHFWPGPLTIVCRQQPSLRWDLGETRGTVAVRMPDDEAALDLLGRTGPLAVSSANATGEPAATNADEAVRMLGEWVEVVLDDGPSPGTLASTILDCTGMRPRILRAGALTTEELAPVLEDLGTELEQPEAEPDADADTAPGPNPASGTDPETDVTPEVGPDRA
jgi:tRNA threonylcarbamoyl adenosine modification protein (Sua5/YciO/YrdC/YwlC family)